MGGPLKTVGVMFRPAALVPWRTIRQNVMLPLERMPRPHAMDGSETDGGAAEAEALLASAGLAGVADREPRDLGESMRQRACLCRALVHRPGLLLLDDPLAALDAREREAFCSVLQRLCLERGFPTILVARDPRQALDLSEEIHVMSARPGRIVATRATSRAQLQGRQGAARRPCIGVQDALRNRTDRGLRIAGDDDAPGRRTDRG